jgi:hypothetical protein
MIEASTMLFFVGAFGPTIDIDLANVPGKTVQAIGLRYSYQKVHGGFLRLNNDDDEFAGEMNGFFLRGSGQSTKGRADIYAGFYTSNFTKYANYPQFMFGADIRTYIVRPWSSFFVRFAGNTQGAVIFLGIMMGYDD